MQRARADMGVQRERGLEGDWNLTRKQRGHGRAAAAI